MLFIDSMFNILERFKDSVFNILDRNKYNVFIFILIGIGDCV